MYLSYLRGADKSLARTTSRCRRMESIVSLEIHAILIETVGEHAPSYATVKNWMAQFKRGDFPKFFVLVGLRTYQHPGTFRKFWLMVCDREEIVHLWPHIRQTWQLWNMAENPNWLDFFLETLSDGLVDNTTPQTGQVCTTVICHSFISLKNIHS
jgi:hypothetical protein